MKLVLNTMHLAVLFSELWQHTVLANNIQQYEQKLTGYNLLMDDYVLQTLTSPSEIFCSLLCINDQDCVSFLFGASNHTCTTFSEYAECDSGDVMENFYVKKGRTPRLICECNLAYNSSFVNVALGKPVTLSSLHHSGHIGSLMVDGNRSYTMPCAHTKYEDNPYALIDLQQSYSIFAFYIVNRYDCWCSNRLHDLKILVGDDVDNLSVCIDHPDVIGQDCTIRAPTNCQGRYVKLQVFIKEFFHVCEVEVYSLL